MLIKNPVKNKIKEVIDEMFSKIFLVVNGVNPDVRPLNEGLDISVHVDLNQIIDHCLFSVLLRRSMSVPVSLLKRDLSEVETIKKSSAYKVYIEDNDGTIYSTKLPSDVSTVN